ncbi:MAG: carotenoid biosynthesis protein [Deltaproteobacteria bacterium]|nr:carotenoid biosynthesis protein [Deltaproteobacteria bacterium]
MLCLELLCAAILVLAVASWLAEDTVIRAYGFYQYSPRWSLFVDRVPLTIALVWPVVIHSAWDLARGLVPGRAARAAAVGGALVLADAALIEPVSVAAGLWSWNEPGIFRVPPIGIVGWAYFALAAMAVLGWAEHRERRANPFTAFACQQRRLAESAAIAALLLLLPPAASHLLLVASWWAGFKWVSDTVPPWPVVAALWALSLALSAAALRSPAGRRLARVDLMARVPAAVFFFVLLALHGRSQPALVAYALAFAPPYLALTAMAGGRSATVSNRACGRRGSGPPAS